MTPLTPGSVQAPDTIQNTYLTRFIQHQLSHLDKIGHYIRLCENAKMVTATSHLTQLQDAYRRLTHEFQLAEKHLHQEPFDELMNDLLHFTAVSSQLLFDTTGIFVQACSLTQKQRKSFISHVEGYFRFYCLNQAIFLSEQEPVFNQKTAVSLLHCLQKPNTINKPVCIQISGSGARQSIICQESLIKNAFDLIFWVLSGKMPQNHIWVDSNIEETAVYLHLWNDALTINPSRLEELQQLAKLPSIYQIESFDGILLPLLTAQKLIQKCNGEVYMTRSNPTVIEVVLPLR